MRQYLWSGTDSTGASERVRNPPTAGRVQADRRLDLWGGGQAADQDGEEEEGGRIGADTQETQGGGCEAKMGGGHYA